MLTVTYPDRIKVRNKWINVRGGDFQVCLPCFREGQQSVKEVLLPSPKKKGKNARIPTRALGEAVDGGGQGSLH